MMSGEDEMTPEEKRASIVEEIISAPTEAVEKIYDEMGDSLAKSAGRALGAAAGVAVGGPVGGVVGAVVGSKAVGKLTSEDGPFIAEGGPSAVGSYPHLQRVGDLIFISGMGATSARDERDTGRPHQGRFRKSARLRHQGADPRSDRQRTSHSRGIRLRTRERGRCPGLPYRHGA